MNWPNMPEVPCLKGLLLHGWVHCLRRGDWRCYDNSCCRGVSIVVILKRALTMPLLQLLSRPLTASRPITMAFLVAFEGLVLWALWCLAMMASIASIAIDGGLKCVHCHCDGVVACCCVSPMHSYDDVASAATFLTSLLTKRENHHSTIDSFYFNALTLASDSRSTLIGGLSFTVNWTNQLLQGNHFPRNTTSTLLMIKQTICQSPDNDFWQLSQNQGQNNQE